MIKQPTLNSGIHETSIGAKDVVDVGRDSSVFTLDGNESLK